jgi:hypothetical protein
MRREWRIVRTISYATVVYPRSFFALKRQGRESDRSISLSIAVAQDAISELNRRGAGALPLSRKLAIALTVGKAELPIKILTTSCGHFPADILERRRIENFRGEWKNLLVFDGDVVAVDRLKIA